MYHRRKNEAGQKREKLIPCFLVLLLYTSPASASPVGITTYAQMTTQLHTDARKSPLVRVVSVGKAASGTRQIWLVRIAGLNTDPAQAQRILVLCRQHGDEPASTEALLRLIHGIALGGDPALRSALSHVTLYIIPMVNPDGAGAGTRVNANGADLNRDWGVFKQPETRAVAAAAKSVHPALIVDAHNWDGNDEYNADCLEVPREMETAQGRAAHAWQHQALSDLAASGYAVHPTAWGDGSDPHLAHRWFLHQNTPSALVETHYGSPADRADFERREGLYTVLVHSLVRRYQSPWTKSARSGKTNEAALFPPPAPPASAHRMATAPKRSAWWFWAIALYALALWGMSLRKPEKEALPQRPAKARYSYPSKRDKKEAAYKTEYKAETLSRSGPRKAVRLPPQ